MSDLTDLKFFKENLDSTLFPDVPDAVEVHNGFASEHAKTASTILAETQKIISEKGATQVMVVSLPSLTRRSRSLFPRRALPGGGARLLSPAALPRTPPERRGACRHSVFFSLARAAPAPPRLPPEKDVADASRDRSGTRSVARSRSSTRSS